jgi:phosphatidylserine/phosphatidylglycerophosphate/cardiolipin synthase-like enzyme
LENVIKVLLPESQAAGRIAEAYFSPGVACRERICRAFREARTSADVCVFTITDNDISQEIARAHARGLRVRIITDNDKSEDRGSDIDRLRDQGVPVRVDETEHHMHHKFAVFDSELLFTGSYNWTRSAASHNQENIAVTSDRALVVPFVDAFELLWKQFTD